MCTSEAWLMNTPAPPPPTVEPGPPLISRFWRLIPLDRKISNASLSCGPTIVAPPAIVAPPGVAAKIAIESASLMETLSVQVPVTMMVLGPVWPTAFSASVMLVYVPPLPPGQPTVTFPARAAAGSRKKVSKIANTGPLNAGRFLMAMLLSFFWYGSGDAAICGKHEFSYWKQRSALAGSKHQ